VPLESHLQECGRCREDVTSLRELWKMLDDAPTIEPPAGFRAQVLSRIESSAGSGKSLGRRIAFDWRSLISRRSLVWIGAAAALLVLVPVVVPGRYTSAWIGSVGDLFHGRSEPLTVSLGAVHPVSGDLNDFVVPLMVKGSAEAAATVRVVRGDAEVLDQSKRITLSSKNPVDVHVKVLKPESVHAFSLEISWSEDGAVQKQTIDIR
jgi:hypothetical protein